VDLTIFEYRKRTMIIIITMMMMMMMKKMRPTTSKLYHYYLLVSLFAAEVVISGTAFVVVTPSTATFALLLSKSLSSLSLWDYNNIYNPLMLDDCGTTSSIDVSGSSMMVAAAENAAQDVVAFDDAFTDSVNFVDGTTTILIAVAAVVAATLVGLKVVSQKMDEAISQVLLDFESTMKQRYPSRWKTIEDEELMMSVDGGPLLGGDERDIKILKVMEELQENDPEFMLLLKEQMPNRGKKGLDDVA
jgi:hypothetical protein